MYHRIIISNFLKTWSLFLNFFHFFIIFSVFRILVISRPFVDPPDPWGTQTFWLWSWIYPRSPWDVSQLQKTASWQLFPMSIVQKPWYGHFHYLGAFSGPLGGRALTWGVLRRLHMVPKFSILAHTSFLLCPSPIVSFAILPMLLSCTVEPRSCEIAYYKNLTLEKQNPNPFIVISLLILSHS